MKPFTTFYVENTPFDTQIPGWYITDDDGLPVDYAGPFDTEVDAETAIEVMFCIDIDEC